MAIKVWDGYDHYNQRADWLSRSGFLQYFQPSTNPATISFVTGRNGQQKAMDVGANFTETTWVFTDRNKSAFFGAAYFIPQQGSGLFFQFSDSIGSGTIPQQSGGSFSTQYQCSVYFNPENYSIQIFRGPIQVDGLNVPFATTMLATSGNNVWTPGGWNFIEIWANIDASTGFVKVYLNNTLVLQATGANTKVTSNAWWDLLGQKGTFGSHYTIDDFYYGDTTIGPGTHTGDAPIGDCHVDTLFANGNSAVLFTPLAGANWQEISEQAMDSDTSYNFSATPTDEDLFNYQSMPAGITLVYGIQVTGAYRKDDSGARSVKQALKSGATEQYGTTYPLSEVTYVYFTDQWILDPDTGVNWIVAGVNAVKAGYNVAA